MKNNVKGGFGVRLRQVMKMRKINQRKLAEMMDKPEGTISRWANGKNSPQASTEYSILSEILDVSVDYLLGNTDVLESSTVNESEPIYNISKKESSGVPYFDIDIESSEVLVNSGGLQIINNRMEIKPAFFINIPKFNDCNFSIRVRGNSMKGKYEMGEIVVCKLLKGWKIFIPNGEPYLIVTKTDNLCVVRFVKENKEDNDYLCLVPYNVEQFESQLIPKSEILFMFEIRGKVNDQA